MTDAITADNADQVAYWNDRAGQTWTSYQERIDASFAAVTRAVVAAAAPMPGESVIDVGCGCGETVIALAQQVTPAGAVLGVDISAPMLARARERIAANHLVHARVAEADASNHAFTPGQADLVFSRFGVMFFADPVAAFANLRRATKMAGRLQFVAWRPLAENPWFVIPLEAGRPLLPPQPQADPTAPGPFAFADPTRVEQILAAAGWQQIRLVPADVVLPLSQPGQFEQAVEFATRVGALARLLGEVDEAKRSLVRAAVADALKPYDGPAGIALGGAIWLVSARHS